MANTTNKATNKLTNRELSALASVNYRWLMTAQEWSAAHDTLIPGGYIDATGTWYLTPKGVAALAPAIAPKVGT